MVYDMKHSGGIRSPTENVSFQNVTLSLKTDGSLSFRLTLLLAVNGAALYAAKRLHGQLQQLLVKIRPQNWAEPEKTLVVGAVGICNLALGCRLSPGAYGKDYWGFTREFYEF